MYRRSLHLTQKKMPLYFSILPLLIILGCDKPAATSPEVQTEQFAQVLEVSVVGNEGDYTFSVTIKSPDTGCSQYADWWEVISEDGQLIYRRILHHSHVTEQPFTRSGGRVPISKDQMVWVRSHMNNQGYGMHAMKGTAASGFRRAETPREFALNLESQNPLPDGCAF